mmetsp:Transcript_86608/g.181458  ORF Transcript_86608/g.181458 Transcript_86608/m.181458 type:complete len:218 (-) Transcript_86608:993-1646(-)
MAASISSVRAESMLSSSRLESWSIQASARGMSPASAKAATTARMVLSKGTLPSWIILERRSVALSTRPNRVKASTTAQKHSSGRLYSVCCARLSHSSDFAPSESAKRRTADSKAACSGVQPDCPAWSSHSSTLAASRLLAKRRMTTSNRSFGGRICICSIVNISSSTLSASPSSHASSTMHRKLPSLGAIPDSSMRRSQSSALADSPEALRQAMTWS